MTAMERYLLFYGFLCGFIAGLAAGIVLIRLAEVLR
jgi:hypothetical protein